jgi:hypothetical protein
MSTEKPQKRRPSLIGEFLEHCFDIGPLIGAAVGLMLGYAHGQSKHGLVTGLMDGVLGGIMGYLLVFTFMLDVMWFTAALAISAIIILILWLLGYPAYVI